MFGIISEVKVVSNEWIKVNQITQSNKLWKIIQNLTQLTVKCKCGNGDQCVTRGRPQCRQNLIN